MIINLGNPWIVAAVASTSLAVYLYHRLSYYRLRQYAHFPQHKPSLLLGHLGVLDKYGKHVVNGGRKTDASDEFWLSLCRDLGNPEIFYSDLRPILPPMLTIRSHAVAEQISKQSKLLPYGAPKLAKFDHLDPLVGQHSIILMSGKKWKDMRRRFNPGFAPQHLLSLMPLITNMSKGLIAKLDNAARNGDICTLNPLLTSLTLDIIGVVAADMELNAQGPVEKQHRLVAAYDTLLETYTPETGSIPWWLEPRVRYRRRVLARQVDEHLRHQIVDQFHRMKGNDGKTGRDVLSLSFQDVETLTPEITTETVDQIKSFFFAGHDTTSNTLQWAIYEVSRHPRLLEAVRAEADAALGTDPDPSSVLAAFDTRAEEILSSMPYTLAIIRETLRRHTTAGSGREIPKGTGFYITLADGSTVCVDGLTLFLCHDLLMLDEEVYGSTVWDFVPERWMTKEQAEAAASRARTEEERRMILEANAVDVPASAFRPFERGPRNCIGQELSMIESRMILALVVRQYDFTKVDLGAPTLGGDGKPLVDAKGRHVSETETYGYRKGTAGPVDGIRTRVYFREGFER
ncbi:cytochrome P450 52A11 [Plectosphaerella plurivora]|uniref:Cytochrome P450 52A11 n=1 Tax=Plectosphaerella plurivora TaxID=936078 RepID=A0A9P8VIJ5_9PEZI|nr:cytochrome P450 52A11 [Plectosphaerella plurivora]